MTIKKFAFEVQSGLRKAHGIDLKRSHVHEVLAALFGFASYSGLITQRVLAQYDGQAPARSFNVPRAAARAMELGYASPTPPIIATEVARMAEADRLCVVAVEEVLAELGIEGSRDGLTHPDSSASGSDDSDGGRDVDIAREERVTAIDLDSPVLRESLIRVADAGSASAHLALAQLEEESLDFESSGISDGRYWFEQQQSGRVLTSVELEWAEAYRHKGQTRSSRDGHLRRAAALGSAEAALQLAEEAPSGESFALAARLAGPGYAVRLGELALSSGRQDDARKWFRIAAERGDTDAMKTLASELESDPNEAWTWVHLAQLLGVDVMAYHAVGEDGEPADADEAGPIYAAGGFELDPLSTDDDDAAKRRARALFAAIAG